MGDELEDRIQKLERQVDFLSAMVSALQASSGSLSAEIDEVSSIAIDAYSISRLNSRDLDSLMVCE